ncbi:LAME_0D03026g1_1 [Lachancea meyersii CBS 8951]|uniref:LAME_0D03026g1_1 n=1 Tax=Lachancea meyersii CBS 8951 TaxID=1266667 RepID=A0A1G4J7H4_9SACH|nr:LAME_0D03026g1_1 [Lachancea meyersii CBS 8951]
MAGLVRYIPKGSLWLCPMFLIGSDLITNFYGGDKGRSTVSRRVNRKSKKMLASHTHRSRRRAHKSDDPNLSHGNLHQISEFN